MNLNLKSCILFLAFSLITGFGIAQNPLKIINKKDRVEVNFDRTLKFNDLVKIKLDMAERGITLTYKKLEFDEFGWLTAIDFHVDCNDGFSGSASNLNITNKRRCGFVRDYSKTASDSPFGTYSGKKE